MNNQLSAFLSKISPGKFKSKKAIAEAYLQENKNDTRAIRTLVEHIGKLLNSDTSEKLTFKKVVKKSTEIAIVLYNDSVKGISIKSLKPKELQTAIKDIENSKTVKELEVILEKYKLQTVQVSAKTPEVVKQEVKKEAASTISTYRSRGEY